MNREEHYNSHRENYVYDEPVYSKRNIRATEEYHDYEAPHRRRSYSHKRVYYDGPIQNHHHKYHHGHMHNDYYNEPLYHRRSHQVYTQAPIVERFTGEHTDGHHHYTAYGLKELERENKQLKKELHRLRKVEASFLSGKKTKVIEKVHTENHHYVDKKNRIENELRSIHTERDNLIREIDALRLENKELLDRNRFLEEENRGLHMKNQELVDLNARQIRDMEETLHNKHHHEITTVHESYKNRHGDFENQLASLRAENQMLKDRHNTHVRTVEEQHTSVINTHANKYETQIRNLQAEIDRLRATLNTLQGENQTYLEEIHKYQHNVYDVPTSNVDYDSIIAKYKNMISAKDQEILHLKSEIERYKNEIHQINLRYSELEARSKLVTDNGERERLLFEINNLKDQLAYREQEISKLNNIIRNAQNDTIRTKSVINEYRSNTTVHQPQHHNIVENSSHRVIRSSHTNHQNDLPVRIVRRQADNTHQYSSNQHISEVQEPQLLTN